MLELMNMAALEANARRRVEVIRDEMRASRAHAAARGPGPVDRSPRAPRTHGMEAGAGDAPAQTCGLQPRIAA